jgi:hypothetical protein
MTSRFLAPLAITVLAAAASPAIAQTADAPCGITGASALETVATGLEGNWTTDFKAGYVVAGPW